MLKNALFDGVVFRSDLSNICLVASLQTMLCLWYVDLSIAFYLDLFCHRAIDVVLLVSYGAD